MPRLQNDEEEATYFAEQLLVPSKFLIEDLRKHESIDYQNPKFFEALAKRYGVSVPLMVRRVEEVRQEMKRPAAPPASESEEE